MGAEIGRVPLIERRAIQADLAPCRRPDAAERTQKRRLSRRALPDHPKAVARLQREARIDDDGLRFAGGADGEIENVQRL